MQPSFTVPETTAADFDQHGRRIRFHGERFGTPEPSPWYTWTYFDGTWHTFGAALPRDTSADIATVIEATLADLGISWDRYQDYKPEHHRCLFRTWYHRSQVVAECHEIYP